MACLIRIVFGLKIRQYSGYVFGVKVQYKHIVVSAQINLKDYSFYIFHSIIIKLGIHDHWANALRKCVWIRNLTPGGHGRGT